MDLIHQAAERAASLTKQLLAFSRKQMIQPHTLNVNAVVMDMDKLLRSEMARYAKVIAAAGIRKDAP